MPLDLNYLPGIEKKTGKTTKDFVAAAIKKGVADPDLKPSVRIGMAEGRIWSGTWSCAFHGAHDPERNAEAREEKEIAP